MYDVRHYLTPDGSLAASLWRRQARSQSAAIERACGYWQDWKEREPDGDAKNK
jgi:hypothetical protein